MTAIAIFIVCSFALFLTINDFLWDWRKNLERQSLVIPWGKGALHAVLNGYLAGVVIWVLLS